jgi:octaprenyl-diphosphate synthase
MTQPPIPTESSANAAREPLTTAPRQDAAPRPEASAADRERELRALVLPIERELELSSDLMMRELESPSPPVAEVSAHARRYRGKRLRAAVSLLTGRAALAAAGPKLRDVDKHSIEKGLTDAHVKIAAIVEMIHMATLVHDDVLDHADVRRRVPTVNSLYGNQVAVLLGDWIYARAFCISTRLEDQTCSRLLSEVTATLCQGEIEQSKAKYKLTLGLDEYLAIIDAKTAALYAASCELGARYSGASPPLVKSAGEFGRSLGVAFQIVDDCLDFEGAEDVVGKSLGTDAAEGKITLPMIFALKGMTPARRRRFEEILREAAASGARGGTALTALRTEFDMARAVAESYGEARRFAGAAVRALDAFPPSEARTCLETMAKYVLGRRW